MLFDLLFEQLVDLRRCRGFIHIAQVAHFGKDVDVPLAGAGSKAEPGDDFHAFLGEVLGAGGGGGGATEKIGKFDLIREVLIRGVIDRIALFNGLQ